MLSSETTCVTTALTQESWHHWSNQACILGEKVILLHLFVQRVFFWTFPGVLSTSMTLVESCGHCWSRSKRTQHMRMISREKKQLAQFSFFLVSCDRNSLRAFPWEASNLMRYLRRREKNLLQANFGNLTFGFASQKSTRTHYPQTKCSETLPTGLNKLSSLASNSIFISDYCPKTGTLLPTWQCTYFSVIRSINTGYNLFVESFLLRAWITFIWRANGRQRSRIL